MNASYELTYLFPLILLLPTHYSILQKQELHIQKACSQSLVSCILRNSDPTIDRSRWLNYFNKPPPFPTQYEILKALPPVCMVYTALGESRLSGKYGIFKKKYLPVSKDHQVKLLPNLCATNFGIRCTCVVSFPTMSNLSNRKDTA